MPADMQSLRHDAPYVRLCQWVGLSLFLHVALVTLIGGAAPLHPHRPLVVDIQLVPPPITEPLTHLPEVPETVPDVAIENLLPQTPNPVKEIEQPPVTAKQAVDLPVPFDRYLSIDEVDIRAEPANDVPLTYPVAAYVRRIPGVVRLTLFISATGKLDRVDLIDASPTGVFEKEAIDTVSKLHFHPATRYGRPVKSQKTIEVVFDPIIDLDHAKPKP